MRNHMSTYEENQNGERVGGIIKLINLHSKLRLNLKFRKYLIRYY
jgi:hypothetical protein